MVWRLDSALIPALWRQRLVDLCEFRASLQSEFQDSQCCTEKSSLKNNKQTEIGLQLTAHSREPNSSLKPQGLSSVDPGSLASLS